MTPPYAKFDTKRVGYENHDITSRLRTLKECGHKVGAPPKPSDIARAVCNTYGLPDATEMSRILEKALASTPGHEATTARGRVRAMVNHPLSEMSNDEAVSTVLRATLGHHMLPPADETIDELVTLLSD